jgi:transposase
MHVAVLGIDRGKNSCSIVGLDPAGRVILRRRLHRDGVVKLAAGLPACLVAMEACCGAHHLGRLLSGMGPEVRLMSPEYVRPYVKAQKNAEAIAEAATRPTMRFVTLKSAEQLDMQSLHRVRDPSGQRAHGAAQPAPGGTAGARHYRTSGAAQAGAGARGGAGRGERGGRGWRGAQPADPRWWRTCARSGPELDRRIAAYDDEFASRAKADEAARRLATIPGIGVLTATALAAAIGGGATFARGRDLAAWRAGATAGEHGRQAEAARHQQAREQIPAQAADPRCAVGHALVADERDAVGRLAARPRDAGPQECSHGGATRVT